MPDTPDFLTIALRVITDMEAITGTPPEPPLDEAPVLHMPEIKAFNAQTRQLMAIIAEQLRLVWNARGAADLAKIDVVLATLMGGTTSGPYVSQLNTAIRALDRSA